MGLFKVNKKLPAYNETGFVITENCSYQCGHCMRGDRRPNTMSKEVIDAFLSQVTIQGRVQLTGGEPLMRIDVIEYLINQIYKTGGNIRKLYAFTNGSVGLEKIEKFLNILIENKCEFLIGLSNDYYHKLERERLNGGVDNINEVYESYKNLIERYGLDPQYYCELEDYKSFYDGRGVNGIGRGANIKGAYHKDINFDLSPNVYISKDKVMGEHISGPFDLQTDGRITIPYDASWEDLDEQYGDEHNILKRSIREIITKRY